MAEYFVYTDELTAIANAIRSKGGTSAALAYPNGFVNALKDIGKSCNVTAAQMLKGKKALVADSNGENPSIVTGTIESLAATTYNTSTSDRTISAGVYLSGAQTITALTYSSNITAANIKKGAVVKIGDTGSNIRHVNITGQMVPLNWGAPTWCPFMWAINDRITPRQQTLSGESSGSNAQKADGYKFYSSGTLGTTQTQKNFRVPYKTKITYYKTSSSSSTSTATLNTGTTYTMQHNDDANIATIAQSGTSVTGTIYKLISYERV